MKSRAIIFTICAVAAITLTACNSNGEQSAVGETSDALISSSDADSEKLIEYTVSRIKETGFSLDITQYYDFQKAEWKQDAQAEIQQMQYNSPSSFSRIVSKVYAILDEYEQNVRLG